MGLAIARGIIIGHSGAIDIEAEYGEGSSVSICIPMVETNLKAAVLGKPFDSNPSNQLLC